MEGSFRERALRPLGAGGKKPPSPRTPHAGPVARKQHPSPTPAPRPTTTDPEARKQGHSDSATAPPSWLILDRFVHRSRRRSGVVDGDSTTSSPAQDCVGRAISASLRIADPPAVSRLHLHWPGRPLIRGMLEPAVIAAHGRSILFEVTVPFRDAHSHDPCFFPVDHFVYSASPCEPAPRLVRLPVCSEGVTSDPEDALFRPRRRQQQRVMLHRWMGLLCRGGDGGEFTVADLTHRSYHEVELCVLHHHQPLADSSIGENDWSVKRLQIPPDMRTKQGLNLSTFDADQAIPIRGSTMAWVDYYQGMLLVDVLHADTDPQLRFIPLPMETSLSRRVCIDEGSPDPARCVSVTDAGIVKLVCITTNSTAFNVTTWTLADIDGGIWEKDCRAAMEASEFWGLCAGQSSLPRVQPSFPVVSLVDQDVTCFLLKEEDRRNFWMIEVNMRTKVLQSSAVYINEDEEERSLLNAQPQTILAQTELIANEAT